MLAGRCCYFEKSNLTIAVSGLIITGTIKGVEINFQLGSNVGNSSVNEKYSAIRCLFLNDDRRRSSSPKRALSALVGDAGARK